MLLLTAVTFGGNESVDALEHLPDEEKEIMKHRAKGLLEIPREQRIPVLVQEIKRLITARRRQLGSADPSRLAKVLAGERGALVEVVLKALPAPLAIAVRNGMPPRPPLKLKREVRQDVLSIIRWKLDDALKGAAPPVGLFKFSDLLTLQQRDLLTICDRMGARALATAFAGLPDEEQAKVFSALPPDQRSLAQRASEAGKARKLTEGDSRTVLEMYDALSNPSAGMRSAGAQRLARACLAQNQEFAVKLIDRHPGELGKLLSRWTREEKNRPLRGDGGRADIVEQMERLAQRGIIDHPMRLPPVPGAPPKRPVVVSPSREQPAVPAHRKSVMVPLAGTSVQRPAVPPRGQGPEPRGPVPEARGGGPMRRTGPKPRRDFMAERNARAAGAASSRMPRGNSQVAMDPRLKATREPQTGQLKAPSARVLRDGKPMPKTQGLPGPGQGQGQVRQLPGVKGKAMTSPALQPIPKRREPVGGSGRVLSGLHRSPVVKGSKPGSDE